MFMKPIIFYLSSYTLNKKKYNRNKSFTETKIFTIQLTKASDFFSFRSFFPQIT